MNLSVIQGRTIRLPADFVSGESRVDPTNPRVEILDPSGAPVVSDGDPRRDGPGQFHFEFEVARNAPVGVWTARWTAVVEGETLVGEDAFEVLPRKVPKRIEFGPRAQVSGEQTSYPERDPLTEEKPDLEHVTEELVARPDEELDVGRPIPELKESRSKVGRLGILLLLAIVALAALLAPWRSLGSAQDIVERGVESHKAGRLKEAEQRFREALTRDANHKLANYNLAVVQQRQGRIQDAERHYRRALSVDQNFVPALFNLAILKGQLGEHEQAAELYRRTLQVQPNMALAHLNLGVALRNLGRRDEGDAEIRRALELDPQVASRLNRNEQVQVSP